VRSRPSEIRQDAENVTERIITSDISQKKKIRLGVLRWQNAQNADRKWSSFQRNGNINSLWLSYLNVLVELNSESIQEMVSIVLP
jgi:hypothetical protein